MRLKKTPCLSTYTRTLSPLLSFEMTLSFQLQEEALHLFGPVHGLPEPQAAGLQAERGPVSSAETRAGPADHGEIRDQQQPAGQRSVCVYVRFHDVMQPHLRVICCSKKRVKTREQTEQRAAQPGLKDDPDHSVQN